VSDKLWDESPTSRHLQVLYHQTSFHLYVPLIARGTSGSQERAFSRRSFSIKEMRTFSRIRPHQSISETINTSL